MAWTEMPEERKKIEAVKAAYRAARTPIERIAACNLLHPSDLALALMALDELDEEERWQTTN
jgi:hypothetical protein